LTLVATEMIEKADGGDEFVKRVKEGIASAKEMLAGLGEGVEEDLESYVTIESDNLSKKLSTLDSRVTAMTTKLSKYRDEARKKQMVELDAIKVVAMKMIRYHKGVKRLSNEALFEAIDENKDEKLDEDEFVKFFAAMDRKPATEVKDEDGQLIMELSEKQVKRVFGHLDEMDEGFISKAVFERLIRHYMKVTKDTVITESLEIKGGKTMRRLEPPEVVEVLEGPVKEETNNVSRVRIRSIKDDTEGWVTISGNQGSVFLQEGGNIFKVVKETIMTDSYDLADSKADTSVKTKTRKLREGETLEVREWPSKQEESGLTRMMCRAKIDGRIGWATTVGNTGIPFIELA